MIKIAVMASGRGTDFQSLIDAGKAGEMPAEIAVLITNNPEAYVIERARSHGIDHVVVDHRGRSREDFERELDGVIRDRGVELIVLAGFMRILTSKFVTKYHGKIMNIHPSLLPSFPGAHAHRDALEYGVKVSGCTVHFVTAEVDGGPVIFQKAVEVLPGDTEEDLEKRVLAEEHILLPMAVRLFAEGRLKLAGKKVVVSDGPFSP